MNELETSLYERVLTHFSQANFTEEITGARREYESLVAPLQPDNPYEEFRLASFHLWFLFFRKIKAYIKSPAQLVLEGKEMRLLPEDMDILHSWFDGVHSLFMVIKVKDSLVYLRNLIGKGTHKVQADTLSVLFQKGEFIEAHIYTKERKSQKRRLFHSPTYYFLPGLCVHPEDASKYILKQAKKIAYLSQAQHVEFLLHLQKCKIKSLRYSNVKAGAFYNENPLF